MSFRVLVVGSRGRLGAALVRAWTQRGEAVRGLGREALDIRNEAALRAALDGWDFDVLVNCAALTNVDYCEGNPQEAFEVNARAVGVMAAVCAEKGRRCIHISTDYVFGGDQRRPYTEEDRAEPCSHYGRAKLAGEQLLLAASAAHLAVRVSWVFGPDRRSFLDQVLERACTQDRVEAVADKVAVPTSTLEAADLLHPLLAAVPAGGVVHLCNAGECTWQQYGQFALDCAERAGVGLRARVVEPVPMSAMKAFVARRPVYSAMATGKLTRLIGRAPRPWQEAVEEYVRGYWRRAQE